MAKDKRIAELPGISSSAMVALSRLGLLTCSDLLNAEFDQVAVVLDDFNEATRLLREARKFADTKKERNAPSQSTPSPLANGNAQVAQRTPMRVGTSAPSGGKMNKAHSSGANVVGKALTMAATKIDEAGEWRSDLQRRLGAVQVLLEHEGTPLEVAGALLLQPAESGELGRDGVNLGDELDQLIEECISLRAVPLLPSGRMPRYYLEMAKSVSLTARRVCAAVLLSGGESQDRAALLGEALLAGEQDELVEKVDRFIDAARRAA
jgi:hypothetical protein